MEFEVVFESDNLIIGFSRTRIKELQSLRLGIERMCKQGTPVINQIGIMYHIGTVRP